MRYSSSAVHFPNSKPPKPPCTKTFAALFGLPFPEHRVRGGARAAGGHQKSPPARARPATRYSGKGNGSHSTCGWMGLRQCAGGLFWLGHFSCPLLFPPTHPPENPTRAAWMQRPALSMERLRRTTANAILMHPCPPLYGESGARRLRPRAHYLCGVAPCSGVSAGRLAAGCGVLRQPMPSAYARGDLRRFAATNAFGVCSRRVAAFCGNQCLRRMLAAGCGVLRQPMPSAYARGGLRRFAATNAFGVCSRRFAAFCGNQCLRRMLAAGCGILRQPMPSAYARGGLRRFSATNAFGVCSRRFAVWCVPVRMGIVLVRSFFIAHAAPTHQTAKRQTMRQTQPVRPRPHILGPQFPQNLPDTGQGLRKNPWALTPRPAPQKYNIRPYWQAP